MANQQGRPVAPWNTLEEVQEANKQMEAERTEAEAKGSIMVGTDEGFLDPIQFVGMEDYIYEHVYWAWPQVKQEQWDEKHLPRFEENGQNYRHYGRLLWFTSGPWAGNPGIYLQQYPGGGELHQTLIAGPLSQGQLKVVLVKSNQFLVKSLRAVNDRGWSFRYVSIDNKLLTD